jgi:restriction system protein
MTKHSHLPKYNQLLNPLLQALHGLGGSAVLSKKFHQGFLNFSIFLKTFFTFPTTPIKGARQNWSTGLAWVRTYLKKYDLLGNSEPGVWPIEKALPLVPNTSFKNKQLNRMVEVQAVP